MSKLSRVLFNRDNAYWSQSRSPVSFVGTKFFIFRAKKRMLSFPGVYLPEFSLANSLQLIDIPENLSIITLWIVNYFQAPLVESSP